MDRRIAWKIVVPLLSSIFYTALMQPAMTADRRPVPPAASTAVPPLPATADRAIGMLGRLSPEMLKAALAQPGLKGRVEALLALSGCDWTVNANAAREPLARSAGAYLNSMEDEPLRAALTDSAIYDRIDAAFNRGQCESLIQDNTASRSVVPPSQANPAPPPYPAPYGYPYAYPGDGRYPDSGQYPNGGAPVPGVPYPGTPYGGYGGYGPAYPGR